MSDPLEMELPTLLGAMLVLETKLISPPALFRVVNLSNRKETRTLLKLKNKMKKNFCQVCSCDVLSYGNRSGQYK